MSETKKELQLDKIMKSLEKTIDKLEGDTLTLEESYKYFSEGINLVKMGNDAIDKVEKKIKILMGDE